MNRAWQDAVFGIRVMVRHWRLAIVTVLTIAAAAATTTAVLSVAVPVLLDPLPFADPDRLYRVDATGAEGERVWVSAPTFADWQDRVRGARFAGFTFLDFSIFGEQGAEPLLAVRVTKGFLRTLGVDVSLGRGFDDNDHRSGGPRSVLLGHAFWRRRYGGDPQVVGRLIDLAGPSFLPDSSGEYRVVGVLPPELWLFSRRLEIVLPLQPSPGQPADRGRPAIEAVLAKVDPDVSADAVRAQLFETIGDLAARYGTAEPVARASMQDARTAHFEEFRPRIVLVLASALLMFALAIVNVAAMLIALAVSRQQEFALRSALGASRFELFHQALVEGLLLGAAGGAVGLLAAAAATPLLRAIVPGPLLSRLPAGPQTIAVDGQIIALVTGAVALLSLASGVVTFFATGGPRLEATSRAASHAGTPPAHGRLRTAILAPQLALAVALAVTTSMLSVSLVQLQSIDLGLNTDRLVGFWINLDVRRHGSARQRADFFDRVIERVRALPEVQSAGGIDHPVSQDRQKMRVVSADPSASMGGMAPEAYTRVIAPGYFESIDVGIVAGRDFVPGDAEGTLPVAIVSGALADRLWPDRDPLGRQVRAESAGASDPWLTVVGVVADVRRVPQENPMALLYRPVRQATPPWLYVMIRSRAEPERVAASLRQVVAAEDDRQPIEGPYIIAEWVRDMTAPLRFVVVLGLAFSVVGVVIAFAGVYALTADLSQRAAREIGIRKALGATTAGIIWLYVYRTARPALPALFAGAAAGAGTIRLLASEVEQVAASALWVTPVVMAFFAALVLTATYLSSRNAAAVDPALTMKME